MGETLFAKKKSRRTVQDGVDGPSGKAKLQADYRVTSLRQFLICNFRIRVTDYK